MTSLFLRLDFENEATFTEPLDLRRVKYLKFAVDRVVYTITHLPAVVLLLYKRDTVGISLWAIKSHSESSTCHGDHCGTKRRTMLI